MKFLLILSLLCLSYLDVFSQNYPQRPTGHVNDYANLLSSNESAHLESMLRTYRDTTSNVITVVTLTDLQGIDIESFASDIFNRWRMWEGDRYNGILILISRDDRAIRIEVGYGLEGVVPDILAGRIVNDIMIPEFRSGSYYSGIEKAVTILMKLATGEYDAMPEQTFDADVLLEVFVILFIIIIFIIVISNSYKNGGHSINSRGVIIMGPGIRMGGGRSGGFGGFSGGGGFGSGGGGASGRW